MTKEDLIKLKEKLSLLSEEEKKQRDLYLRKLANGELQGPPVGYPSIDKPWLKWYEESFVEKKYESKLNNSVSQELSKLYSKFSHDIAISYFGKNILYSELKEKSEQFAKGLLKLGVNPGDIVTICVPCVPEFAYFFDAINRVGAISNWIDFRIGRDELIASFKDINSNIIITFGGVDQKVNEAIEIHNSDISCTAFNHIIKINPSDSMINPMKMILLLKEHFSSKQSELIKKITIPLKQFVMDVDDIRLPKLENLGDSPAAIVYTGGTTGRSKGVILTNNNLNSLVDNYNHSSLQLNETDSFLHFLPPWTAYGIAIYYFVLSRGMECKFIPKLDPSTYDRLIKREKPSSTTGIPKNLEILVNSKYISQNDDLSFFKYVGVGADSLSEQLELESNLFLKNHNSPASVSKGYGMTETCATFTTTSDGINKVKSVGIPFYRNEIMIYNNDTNCEVQTGQYGEILMSGPSVMKGYYNNTEETSNVLKTHDGKIWMHSGDIGYIDEDGFLYIIGREKKMFVRSGFKLFSSEIENAVSHHDAVKNVCAVGVENEFEGSVPVVSIVLKEKYSGKGLENTIIHEINEICKSKLYEYYFPINYRIVDELPYTRNGKVDFKKIKKECEIFLNQEVFSKQKKRRNS